MLRALLFVDEEICHTESQYVYGYVEMRNLVSQWWVSPSSTMFIKPVWDKKKNKNFTVCEIVVMEL